jgi:hypothetical protein
MGGLFYHRLSFFNCNKVILSTMNMVSTLANSGTQLANWAFSKPAISTAAALDNPNHPAGLIVRDSLQNFGMISEAKQKSPEFGQEMSLIMWGTAFIWGGGSFLLKHLYEGALHQTNVLPFINADGSPEQKSLLQTIKQTSQSKFAELPVLQKQLNQRFEALGKSFDKIPPSTRKIAQAVGIGLSVILPSYLVGVKLQEFAHHRTHNKSDAKREALYQHIAKQWQPSLFALDASEEPNTYTTKATKEEKKNTTANPAPRKGADLATNAIAAVDFLNTHPAFTNLGVDGFITGGRLTKSEGNYDRLSWAVNEAILVFMVYFGSQLLNDALKKTIFESQTFGKATPISELSFDAVASLRQNYGMPNQNFRKSYVESLDALGLSDLAHLQSDEAEALVKKNAINTPIPSWAKGMTQDVLEHAKFTIEPNEDYYAKVLLNKKDQVAEAIQTYMAKTPYKKGENVIIDTLIANGTLPVWHENFKLEHLNPFHEKRILGQDISKPLNQAADIKNEPVKGFSNHVKTFFGFNNPKQGILDNFKTVEGVFHKLNQLAQYEDQAQVTKIINKGMGAKAFALVGSLVVSYAILGVASPKLQHWAASHFSGEAIPERLKPNVDKEAIKNEIVAEAIKKKLQEKQPNEPVPNQLPSLLRLGKIPLYPRNGKLFINPVAKQHSTSTTFSTHA